MKKIYEYFANFFRSKTEVFLEKLEKEACMFVLYGPMKQLDEEYLTAKSIGIYVIELDVYDVVIRARGRGQPFSASRFFVCRFNIILGKFCITKIREIKNPSCS